jgi:hypothetical protein
MPKNWRPARGVTLTPAVTCHQAYKPGAVPTLSRGRWPFIWDAACATPLATNPDDSSEDMTERLAPPAPSLFGLAPGGVCRAVLVTKNAVRSYRTLSPLPQASVSGGTRRFAFCCTVPGVAPAGCYPAPYLHGARTFLSARRYAGTSEAAIRPADIGNKGFGRRGVKRLWHPNSEAHSALCSRI